jgi:hypothetical protein
VPVSKHACSIYIIAFLICFLFEEIGIEWFCYWIFSPTRIKITVSTDRKIPCPVVGSFGSSRWYRQVFSKLLLQFKSFKIVLSLYTDQESTRSIDFSQAWVPGPPPSNTLLNAVLLLGMLLSCVCMVVQIWTVHAKFKHFFTPLYSIPSAEMLCIITIRRCYMWTSKISCEVSTRPILCDATLL